jgi:hypothetical protein
MMKIETQYPPNYTLIISMLPSVVEDTQAVFCYGDTIYNPHNRELTQDIINHEMVHSQQQGSDVDGWYMRYLTDAKFRLKQEIEAYGLQYKSIVATIDKIKSNQPELPATKLKEHALNDLAYSLAGETYGKIISFGEAQSKIKNEAAR